MQDWLHLLSDCEFHNFLNINLLAFPLHLWGASKWTTLFFFFVIKNRNLLKWNEQSPSFTWASSVPFMDNTIMSAGITYQTSAATFNLPNWISSNVVSPSVDLVEMCQPRVSCAMLQVGCIRNMENGEQKPFLLRQQNRQNELFEVESRAEEGNGTTCTIHRPARDFPSNHPAPTYPQSFSFI